MFMTAKVGELGYEQHEEVVFMYTISTSVWTISSGNSGEFTTGFVASDLLRASQVRS